MSKSAKRHHAPSHKADVLRSHHKDKVPVSELCNLHQLQPSVFYKWQQQLFDHAALAFAEPKPSSREEQLEAEVAALRAKLAKKEHVIAELSEELIDAKKEAGDLFSDTGVESEGFHDDTRDAVVDLLRSLSERTELSLRRLIGWLCISRHKFYNWLERYGKANEHNAKVPRDHWLLPQEKQAILDFHSRHPLDGYRRLTFMMIDADLVACSPASVYRVLSSAGLLDRWNKPKSKKGTGFLQPVAVHQHWHVDIAHLNLCGTFYYLCSVLDGASRAIVHHEVRQRMTELDVECILQRAREKYPQARPRIISDNGPQFIAGEFKDFIRQCGMTHVRTSPHYPQSNGKLERWHRTFKHDAFRPASPQTFEEAIRVVDDFVDYYNGVRLHSAIGYIAPHDWMAGKQEQIWAERDRRIEAARVLRAQRRAVLGSLCPQSLSSPLEDACV